MTSRISAIALTAGILFSNLIFAQQDPPASNQVQSHKAKEIVPYKAKIFCCFLRNKNICY